jgi:ABC-type nitrate/sulfonate/bicarbonate transport system permease component
MDDAAPRASFPTRYRKALLGGLSVVLFFAAWQAIFLVVPFNPLFISKPSLIASGLADLITSGDLLRDLAVSAVPFLYGFSAAVLIGVPLGIVMGWRVRVGYALDPLMTVFYASPLVALAPLVVIFFGVGVGGKTLIIFFSRSSPSSSMPLPGCAPSIRCSSMWFGRWAGARGIFISRSFFQAYCRTLLRAHALPSVAR